MKKALHIFSFLFSLVVLFSCEPSRAENGDFLNGVDGTGTGSGSGSGTGGGGTGVVKQLKSVTAKDDTGETITYNYTYTSGKLISVKASDNSVKYDLSYDGSSINKITVVQNEGTTVTTTNFTLTYSNGKFVEAKGTGTESTGSSFKNTITATYTDNKISKILSKMVGIDSADPNVSYDMFTLQSDITYTGNNIASWKFSTAFPPMPPITIPPIVITSAFSDYDSKINPFNTLPEAYNIVSSLYGLESTAVTGFSANNYKKITVSSGTDTQSATYTYTYDADGYPLKASAGSMGTLTFEYQ
ncbi:hypothetical protein KSK37_10710 [Kaistella sp. DKR-2]|uniref:hypothetical protein n=1 Tax=Kaistella soli TaxID=2849654 RepID=UPI001C27A76E|nr:hypothetical protein [Kaistella soli]MBU8883555.1 hypothetical protein [Kaistella soli]